jgi:hypothetical protein
MANPQKMETNDLTKRNLVIAFMEAQHQFVARFLYSDLNCSEKILLQDPKTKI